MSKVLAYVLRHGSTGMSPAPEGWLQVPLNALGRAEALDGAEFINNLSTMKPDWVVSSDLKRAIETADIAAKVLGAKIARPIPNLRAFSAKDETQEKFEARSELAFPTIISIAKQKKVIPLIVCHRSNTAWIAKKYGGVRQKIDYRQASMVWEGGVIVIDENGARPLYKTLLENPRENLAPSDGTAVSGFVTIADNKGPRECGNCKWLDGDHCDHPVVVADDEIGMTYGLVRNKEGKWVVPKSACCNSFQNKIDIVTTS